MKNLFYIIGVMLMIGCTATPYTVMEPKDFNFDWEFQLKEIHDSTGVLTMMQEANGWEEVRLPHDWVIGGEYDLANKEFAPATGYIYGGGIGWYRKTFTLNLEDHQKATILFDGVYNNSEVYLNGHRLGFHPYGYSPFYYDLTPYLLKGEENLLMVKVDHSSYADSRWYTGAGIYRNVSLKVTDKLHIPIWGAFVQTPEVTDELVQVAVATTVRNDYKEEKTFGLKTQLFDQNGKEVAVTVDQLNIAAGKEKSFTQKLSLENPRLWGIEAPHLYKYRISLVVNGNSVSDDSGNFGVRSFRFDPDSGFYLNGENRKIKGVCLHHDAGLVGTAVPKDVWRRRLQILKEGGCNAIRIAHNPGSSEFLDLCDEMGFLVQDEFFDEWDNPKDKRWNQKQKSAHSETEGYGNYFQEYAEQDLKSVMLAHRNHPSIIQWSIGNEIEWTYPRTSAATGFFNNMNWKGNYFWSEPPFSREEIQKQLEILPKGIYDIGTTAEKLVKWTKEMDTSRPVVANCILPSASHETAYGKSLDIVGYSYRRVLYDYGHENYPEKVIMGTENLAQYHEWKAIMERPFIAGTFLWTGINYLGEIRGEWPVKGNNAGLLDFAGFTKPSYHMMKTLWNDEPHTYIATQLLEKSLNKIDPRTGEVVAKNPEAWKQALWEWHDVNNHWNYIDGEMISVELYSNCEEVELMLNGRSLGKKQLADFEDHIYKWAMPFEAGKLTAIGVKDGVRTETVLQTAGEPVAVKLSIDREVLEANHYDVAHVVAQLVDAQGIPVKNQERRIQFQVPEGLRVLGVDNGAVDNVQPHLATSITTSNGKALLALQSKGVKGKVDVTAKVEKLLEDRVFIQLQDPKPEGQVYAEAKGL
ncbi:sugar-binding domain-containing protein [Algivirga pacifica]|uniref:Glycoside hydrolase family 2 TIM barrel-domain containing protein n=1 Tax=Algivirga pacifica TaxID=1162670 RepID=A0ABP9CZE1_9BACT